MNIKEISNKYCVRSLTEKNIEICYELMRSNPMYYKHCPPEVSIETPKEDMLALPPNKTYSDKYYIGYFLDDKLICIADIIESFPNNDTVFIGFFMVHKNYQGMHIGSSIIKEIESYYHNKFLHIRLGYVSTNLESKVFWEKNGFKPTGVVAKQELYDVVVLQKEI